jgi:hypothetical protein
MLAAGDTKTAMRGASLSVADYSAPLCLRDLCFLHSDESRLLSSKRREKAIQVARCPVLVALHNIDRCFYLSSVRCYRQVTL